MVTDIEEIKCKKIYKFVEIYDLLTHIHTHTHTQAHTNKQTDEQEFY